MMVKVVLHGQRGVGEVVLDASTAADAIEGFTRQTGVFDDLLIDQRPLLRVVGFPTVESLHDALPEGTSEIHLVPAMFGGGGSFGRILLGAALIAASFIPGLGQAVQVAILSAGIGMSIGGVMGLFMKSPKASKNTDPDASKYFGANGNTTASGTPIPRRYGRVPVFGQILSQNVDAQDLILGQFPVSPA